MSDNDNVERRGRRRKRSSSSSSHHHHDSSAKSFQQSSSFSSSVVPTSIIRHGNQDSSIQTMYQEFMFEITLNSSDVVKGSNHFIIPNHHAEKYFPPAGVSLWFEDESGKFWKIRYSYWSSSDKYVLTRGWSGYIQHKKLESDDVVLFLRHILDSKHFFIRYRRKRSFDQNSNNNNPTNYNSHHQNYSVLQSSLEHTAVNDGEEEQRRRNRKRNNGGIIIRDKNNDEEKKIQKRKGSFYNTEKLKQKQPQSSEGGIVKSLPSPTPRFSPSYNNSIDHYCYYDDIHRSTNTTNTNTSVEDGSTIMVGSERSPSPVDLSVLEFDPDPANLSLWPLYGEESNPANSSFVFSHPPSLQQPDPPFYENLGSSVFNQNLGSPSNDPTPTLTPASVQQGLSTLVGHQSSSRPIFGYYDPPQQGLGSMPPSLRQGLLPNWVGLQGSSRPMIGNYDSASVQQVSPNNNDDNQQQAYVGSAPSAVHQG